MVPRNSLHNFSENVLYNFVQRSVRDTTFVIPRSGPGREFRRTPIAFLCYCVSCKCRRAETAQPSGCLSAPSYWCTGTFVRFFPTPSPTSYVRTRYQVHFLCVVRFFPLLVLPPTYVPGTRYIFCVVVRGWRRLLFPLRFVFLALVLCLSVSRFRSAQPSRRLWNWRRGGRQNIILPVLKRGRLRFRT